MPSGAKKRKAAKKKKEQEANNITSITNNTPHGHDDPKSQDDRDSDGGDVGSPASQDQQDNRHPFHEGDEIQKRESSLVQTSGSENKMMEVVSGGEATFEKLGTDHDIAIRVEKSEEKLEDTVVSIKHVGHERRSSSSSSDDECQAVVKKEVDETDKTVFKAASHNVEDKAVDSKSEKMMQVTENVPVNIEEADIKLAAKLPPVSTSEKSVISVPEVVNISVGPNVEKKDTEEDKDKLLPASNGVTKAQVEVNEDKMLLPSSSPSAESSNVRENTRELKVSSCPEKQPLVASVPQVAQRTSWFNCCGLFDVLTGSGR